MFGSPLYWLPVKSIAMRVNVVSLVALATTAAGRVSSSKSIDNANNPSQVLSLPRHELERKLTPTALLLSNGNLSSKMCFRGVTFGLL